jgi:peptide subunit release factor 1 (eRF1)
LVVTAYLRLGVQDRIRNRYRTALRDAVRRANLTEQRPVQSHPDRAAIQRDLQRIVDYVENPARLPHSPGLVLVACEALGILEAVPLPHVLHCRVLLGDRPRLAEAMAAAEEFGRILVAAIDRAHARFFEVTTFGVTELPCAVMPATRGGKYHSDRQDSPGWGEKDFHNRIQEERHRHSAAVAHHLTALASTGPCRGIVLVGPTKTVAEQLPFLPRDLAPKVMGTARLNPTSVTPAEIRSQALEVRAAWELDQQRKLVAELNETVGSGWAVNGARETLRALSRGQVRVLLVPAQQSGRGFRCEASGRLVLARAECRGEGDAVPVEDLVNEIIEEALRQRVGVEVIQDPIAAGEVDGLAAFLRFRQRRSP